MKMKNTVWRTTSPQCMRVAAVLLVVVSFLAARAAGCPANCSCPDAATVVCRGGWPAAAPLPLSDVSRLVVEGAVGTPPDGLFANATHLLTLQLLDARRLRLKEHSFVGLHLLRELSAVGCGLSVLPPRSLALLPRLETLDLSENSLSRLHRHQFTYNTHLRRLNLSGNPLSNGVNSETFFGADRLRELDLSRCRLRRASGAWFRRLPALEQLSLAGNELTSVRAVDTQDWRALRSLDLSTNVISHVERGTFNTSANLTRVDISGNYLSKLLGTGMNCSHLDISNNSFTVANRSHLELPAQLKELTLSRCGRLVHVGRNLLQFSLKVEVVNISTNGILTEIEHTAFSHLDNLKSVDLSNNALEKLPRSLSTATLETLNLVGNNFNCDCSLQWYSRQQPGSTLTCRMGDSTARLADGLAHVLCDPVSVTVHQTQAWAPYNTTAVLECRAAGHPAPALTWITPQRYVFHWAPEDTSGAAHRHPHRHTAQLDTHRELDHYLVLPDGRLQVHGVAARHQGRYVCLAEGDSGSAAGSVYLTVGVSSLHDVKMMALLMALTGCVTAITFALVVRLGLYIFYKCGCCTCCTDELPPRAKKIKGMMDSMEQWRALQLAGLRDSYNQQVAGIKDSCYQQVERIRDTYKGQARYMSDMREYGAQQIEGFREQYLDQVRRVRDYSLGQMNRVHENYIFQRNRIRKFSAHQRVRLRETCKYQQKTLNKLLETLPDLYLQNCRTGTCQRTDSMMLPGDQQFYCDADIEWTAEQLAAVADLYPPGEHLAGLYPPGEHLAGMYPPGEHLAGLYPPGEHLAGLYPPGEHLTGLYPPGEHLAGLYPPGEHLAGLYPPGEHLAGLYPPGEHLTGLYPPGEHLAGLYPPGEHLTGLPEEGEEPEPPGAAGAELTRRLLALAPALEAADREAARREEEDRRRAEEQEERAGDREGEGESCRESGVNEADRATDRAAAELLLAVDRPLNDESHGQHDSEPRPALRSESQSQSESESAPVTAAEELEKASSSSAAASAAAGPLLVRVVRGSDVSPGEVEVVVLEAAEPTGGEERQAESVC